MLILENNGESFTNNGKPFTENDDPIIFIKELDCNHELFNKNKRLADNSKRWTSYLKIST